MRDIKLTTSLAAIAFSVLPLQASHASDYNTDNDPPLDGHFESTRRICLADAAGAAYLTPGRNGAWVTHCEGKSVLAFRGTDHLGDDLGDHLVGNNGWNAQYRDVDWNGINENAVYDYCVGHSLGGALAKRHNFEKPNGCIEVVTFGAPAIADIYRPDGLKQKITAEYVNFLRGGPGWGGWGRIKDLIPTLVAGGHDNIDRMENWTSYGFPALSKGAHGMYHYRNKFLGACPTSAMINDTPDADRVAKWDAAQAQSELKMTIFGDNLSFNDLQGCEFLNPVNGLTYVKRYTCTQDQINNPNCPVANTITIDYASKESYDKEGSSSSIPIQVCLEATNSGTKTTTCTQGPWNISGHFDDKNGGDFRFDMEIPEDATNVHVKLLPKSGADGDPDLYVTVDGSIPTRDNFLCRSWEYANIPEKCDLSAYDVKEINVLSANYSNYMKWGLEVSYDTIVDSGPTESVTFSDRRNVLHKGTKSPDRGKQLLACPEGSAITGYGGYGYHLMSSVKFRCHKIDTNGNWISDSETWTSEFGGSNSGGGNTNRYSELCSSNKYLTSIKTFSSKAWVIDTELQCGRLNFGSNRSYVNSTENRKVDMTASPNGRLTDNTSDSVCSNSNNEYARVFSQAQVGKKWRGNAGTEVVNEIRYYCDKVKKGAN